MESLAFHPPTFPGREPDLMIAGARATAERILALPGISAVVASNDCAAIGLCRALQEHALPRERWPAIIGFDGRMSAVDYVLTSLRLPWEEVGRTAADYLWERRNGSYRGQPRLRQIPMRLIHRVGVQGLP
jgi:LacI family transcriptional regulator